MAVRAHRPDVVLLDMALPDISGAEVCRQIKEDEQLKDVFVILTADIKTLSEHQADGFNMWADSFLIKPISNKELLARIQSMERIKKAEEALQASETRYRRLFETAQDGILILNAETGQIDDVNPFLIDMLGYTYEEFAGKKLWEIGAFKNTEKSKAALAELQHKGYVRYEDLPLATKDGREIDVEFVSNTYPVNHHMVIQCNIRDITDRKRAEDRLLRSEQLFHTIAQASPVGLFRTDKEGRRVYVNKCWSELTGLSFSEALGDGWVKTLHPADKKRVLNQWNRSVGKNLPFQSEYRILRQDGTVKWVIGNAVVESSIDGVSLGYLGTIADITDRKRIEEELQKTHDELEKRVAERTAQLVKLNKSLEQEITKRINIEKDLKESQERLRNLTKHLQTLREQERASLSRELHDELGQSLTGMKMDMRWIERRLPEHSEPILERLHSTIVLINEAIHSVQKISMALRPPALDDFGLSEAIKLVLTNIEKKAQFKCTFVSKPQRIVLNGELSTQIFRIFQEALANIARHAGAKHVTVLLQNAGDTLIMKVGDDGRGITKKQIVDQSSIGLTGMRERAYAIEGNLAITGMRGKGTIVTLNVPLNSKNKDTDKNIKRGLKKKTPEEV